MIQSIGDYENWRDSLHDRPGPDNGGPDERSVRFYTHDYPGDTKMEYIRTGERAELRLSFSSEDPDMGTEEMLYGGEKGESMIELAADLRADLTGYLDDADRSSFFQQQGLPQPDGIHSHEDYLGEYSRTALYAFEGILQQTERESRQNLRWKPLTQEKLDWVYSDSKADPERGCVGHLRGDFGHRGNEFWTSWFDHQPVLKNEAFRNELQDVVNGLRRKGGLLENFQGMNRQCRKGLVYDDSFSFQAETGNYMYCLRCTPRRGDYNFYLYAYDKNAQRKFEQTLHKPEKSLPDKHKNKKNEMER